MDSIETTTRFWYSTLGPSLLLLPVWFLYGRRVLRGQEEDWESINDNHELDRGLPGVVAFGVALWWREHHYRREHPLPEVALGIWGVWALHVLVQVFFVSENDQDARQSWSIANHYFGLSIAMSSRMGFGLLIDLWMIMIIVLWVSYWTWETDSNHGLRPPRSTLQLLTIKMTDSLKPAQFLAPLWLFLGHYTLWGSGVYLPDLWVALFVLTPFHVWLCNHNNSTLLSPEEAFTLLTYYGILFLSQFLVPDGVLQHYFRLPPAIIFMGTWVCKLIMAIAILILLVLHYWQEREEDSTNPILPSQATPAATTTSAAATLLSEPLLSTTVADTVTAAPIVPTTTDPESPSTLLHSPQQSDEQL